VLRDGKWISSAGQASTFRREQVISEMVGAARWATSLRKVEVPTRRPADVGARDLSKEGAFTGVNFDIYAGEVLGFAGLIGARRTDVGLALFGIEPADSGEIVFEGAGVESRRPSTP
jgi:rhamnose transport system ATP-binding protein